MDTIIQLTEEALLDTLSTDKVYPITKGSAVYLSNGSTLQSAIDSGSIGGGGITPELYTALAKLATLLEVKEAVTQISSKLNVTSLEILEELES